MTDPTKPHLCTCGRTHQVKLSKHTLHAGLVNALETMHEEVMRRKMLGRRDYNEIHLRRDLHLGFDATTNFSKLAFLGLATHWLRPGRKRRGYWAITNLGIAFVEGREKVEPVVYTDEGEIVRREGYKVGIDHFKRKEPNWGEDAPDVEPEVKQLKLA